MDSIDVLKQEIAHLKLQATNTMASAHLPHVLFAAQGRFRLCQELEQLMEDLATGKYQKEQEIQKGLDN